MAQSDYRRCPITATSLVIYQSSSSLLWGIARRKLTNINTYDYLTENFNWSAEPKCVYQTEEVAKSRADEYIAKVIREAVVPSLIDQSQLRVAFCCPHCGLVHKCQLNAPTWEELRPVLQRICPKTTLDLNVLILIEKYGKLFPAAPIGDIPHLPKWNCPECFGTGEYTGLTLVEPCSTCFPKRDK